jgi:hypothetical protein
LRRCHCIQRPQRLGLVRFSRCRHLPLNDQEAKRLDYYKDELFAEIRDLEDRAFSLMGDDSRQGDFDKVIQRTDELTVIAKQRGWI